MLLPSCSRPLLYILHSYHFDCLDDLEPNKHVRWPPALTTNAKVRRARLHAGDIVTSTFLTVKSCKSYIYWCSRYNSSEVTSIPWQLLPRGWHQLLQRRANPENDTWDALLSAQSTNDAFKINASQTARDGVQDVKATCNSNTSIN